MPCLLQAMPVALWMTAWQPTLGTMAHTLGSPARSGRPGMPPPRCCPAPGLLVLSQPLLSSDRSELCAGSPACVERLAVCHLRRFSVLHVSSCVACSLGTVSN